ncbi:hypothetical protein KFZ70_10650 [Tamlana fucoidanivorans]|uniref:Uncharacterized protein n=1 Tax=Allotamlana fucoidanivorans TaxID=2583814 RepID=A0A5C4SNC1_9FLAO|nr:hypothetical protein [Tamlana fucoidanivorans]TNJ45679.1 hypothetical protein FGF67_04675 [Tamlana fucoidanivorans]
MLQENHDISAFYRGASLKPVFFNTDDTIFIPKDDRMYPGPGRTWEFEASTMGWQTLNGTNLYVNRDVLSGNAFNRGATVKSAPWLYTDLSACKKLKVKLKNSSYANQMKIALYTRNEGAGFWTIDMDNINWDEQNWVTIPISANDTDFATYTIELTQFGNINKRLMQLAIKPIFNAFNGLWEIDEISIE